MRNISRKKFPSFWKFEFTLLIKSWESNTIRALVVLKRASGENHILLTRAFMGCVYTLILANFNRIRLACKLKGKIWSTTYLLFAFADNCEECHDSVFGKQERWERKGCNCHPKPTQRAHELQEKERLLCWCPCLLRSNRQWQSLRISWRLFSDHTSCLYFDLPANRFSRPTRPCICHFFVMKETSSTALSLQ